MIGAISIESASMSDNLKSGRELLEDFFSSVKGLKVPDKEVARTVLKLYKGNKLSNTNLTNELAQLKEHKLNDKS